MADVYKTAIADTVTVSFGGTSYPCRSVPAGVPESCEPPDITTTADNVQQFCEAAVTEDGELSMTFLGTGAPNEGDEQTLTITLSLRDADGTSTTHTVNCGKCIVTGVTPGDIEHDGDRVKTVQVTFKPNGAPAATTES